jgi:hypothetical protein
MGQDHPVNDTPDPPDLLTVTDICRRHRISRQSLHLLRTRGVFPAPVPSTGIGRPHWTTTAVDAYFRDNPSTPGRSITRRFRPPADH